MNHLKLINKKSLCIYQVTHSALGGSNFFFEIFIQLRLIVILLFMCYVKLVTVMMYLKMIWNQLIHCSNQIFEQKLFEIWRR